MEVEPRLTRKQLKGAEKGAGQSKHLRVVILVEGWAAPASDNSRWLVSTGLPKGIYRFNEQDLAGLEDQRGRHSNSPIIHE